MINLLSTDNKAEIRAARVNVFLLRYIGIILMGIIFLLGVLFVYRAVLQRTETSAQARIDANQTQASTYSDTQEQVTALSSRLSDAKGILDQETSYAHILTTLGQLMPANTVLEGLDLSETALSGEAVELVAYAKTDTDAVKIQQQLQGSQLFTQVSPKGTDSSAGIDEYPIKVTLTVIFNKSGI